MKAAVISAQGNPVAPNVNVVNDWPVPKLVAGEVLIRTEACALNQLDLWVGRGLPGLNLSYPRISGSDGVGIVEAVGQEVDSAWIGKRVVLNAAIPQLDQPAPDQAPAQPDRLMIGEHLHGTLAEKFIAPTANVLDIGDADPVEAAAFGLVHLTAWRMMWTRARIAPGQWVLITGIGGGVALAALGIARHFGCRTIVTSRHAHKLDAAKNLGAEFGVLDKGEDFSREIRLITSKRGVDVCVDSVGKAVHLPCIKSLARGGVFVTCGNTSGPDAVTDLSRVFWNELSILGSTMGDMHEFRQVIALFRSGALKPVVDRVFPASEASDAFARLESAEQFGKVVVKWT
jgi:NADPH:quinone reductase-like Zn-dependent oxidoreductase